MQSLHGNMVSMVDLFFAQTLQKMQYFMTLCLQKLPSNYILCVRWKKKLFWRFKLWLSWKQCVILAWRSQTWVVQTCESAKQTTRIASAVTIWERSWTLFSIPWRAAIWSSLLSAGAVLKLGCLVWFFCRFFFRSQMKEHWVKWVRSRNMLRYATRMNNRYIVRPYESAEVFAFAAEVSVK